MLSLDQIARALGGEKSAGQVLAPGPNHSATDRSMSVKLNQSGDDIIVHSFAGDDPIACKKYVRGKLDLPAWQSNGRGKGKRNGPIAMAPGKRAAPRTKAPRSPRTVVAEYEYRDAEGALLYQVVRYDPKDFGQRRPDGRGGWTYNLKDVPRVLYRLPELIEDSAAVGFICEGEKDVLRLVDLGLCATTISGGTKWTAELIEPLRGREVIIVADCDEPGATKALQAATALHGIAASVRLVLLPGLTGKPDYKDVSDWLDADPKRAEILADLCLKAPHWTPETPPTVPADDPSDRVLPTPDLAADGDPDVSAVSEGVLLDDFYALMPMHSYIFTPSREMWPASSVNARISPVPDINANGKPALDKKGEQKMLPASTWLDQNKPVEQMTWAPGMPMLIGDRLIAEGGWIERKGVSCFNLYRPPAIQPGDSTKAGRWIDHVHKVFGDDANHIVQWLAHRVQCPQDKINHALVLGGAQGIGKDTLLEPVKQAIGPWNFFEASPQQMLGRFNGFLKSVILRVSEARDLGDVDRFKFYDHMKAYTAAPPDVLRVDEKHLREHSVMNVCGVIVTSNYKTDGIYLPADDRRHFVAWSDLVKEEFTPAYWKSLWGWYVRGGNRDVAAYLATLDVSAFDPKAPPPKTPAFWDIVDANRAPEDAELADVLDQMDNPDATTLARITGQAMGEIEAWIKDRKNRRVIPHRLDKCGYIPVRNDAADDGLWKISGKRQVVYAKKTLSIRDRLKAAYQLSGQSDQ
jgi:hypothetical protein